MKRAIDVGHGVARVVTHGESPARLVVVPPLGMPAEVLDPFVRKLVETLSVSVVELPGSGRASRADERVVSTERLGDALSRVLHELGGRPHLFGVSLGGMISQWAAARSGDAIDRLVLASCCARGRDAMFAEPVGKLALLVHARHAATVRAGLAEALVEDPDERDRVEKVVEARTRDDAELVWLAAAAVGHDASAVLSSIRAPTLVVSGENDVVVPESLQAALAAAIPGASRVTIARAGHAVAVERPTECARIVLEHVAGTTNGGRA